MDPERRVKVKLFVFHFSFHLLLYSCESKLDDLLFLISRIFFFKHCGLRDAWGLFFFNVCDFLIERVVAGKGWRMKC